MIGCGWRCATKAFRERFDAAWLKLPLVGRLSRGYNAARFASTLAMLAGAGVPILKALQAAAETLSNRAMRADALDALVLVREGAPLASALAQKKRFPGLLSMFARLGEQTGQLPPMLQRAANQLGAEVQRRAMQLATILEPLLIVGMGLVVMLIVLAVLMPIIQLNQFVEVAAEPPWRGKLTWPPPWTTSWWWRSRRARCSTSRKRTASSRAATPQAYMQLQLERLDQPAAPGHRLLADQEAAGLQRRRRRSASRW